jgi:hypothetical protein
MCGWLLYKMPTTADMAPLTTILPENKCYFDGKIYSAGSTVKTVAGDMQECIPANDLASAMWGDGKRAR